MIRIMTLLAAFALYGCATTTVYTADGKPASLAKCKHNRTNCLSIAGKKCKEAGYTIIEEDQTELAKGSTAIANGYGGGSFEVRQNYGIIFRCNENQTH